MMAKDVFREEPKFTKWLTENPEFMVNLLGLCNYHASCDDLDSCNEVSVHGGRVDIWEAVSQTLIEANYNLVNREHLCKPIHYCYGMIKKYDVDPKRIVILTEKSDDESRGFIKHQNETTNYNWYLIEFNLGYTKNGKPHVNFHLIVSPQSKNKVISEIKQKIINFFSKDELENTQRNTTKPDYRNDNNLDKLKGIIFTGNVGKGVKSVPYNIQWVGPGDLFKSNYGFEGTLNNVGFNTREHIAINIQKRQTYAANGSTWKMVSNQGLCIDDILSNK